ncbi:MAG: hypothetical protein ABIH25_00310 [Candidatus Woesearchaeota archaeon]
MKKYTPIIKNIVAIVDLETSLDLESLSTQLENVSEYNKTKFPGLCLKSKIPGLSYLLFENGKVVLTGAKSEEELQQGTEYILHILKDNL